MTIFILISKLLLLQHHTSRDVGIQEWDAIDSLNMHLPMLYLYYCDGEKNGILLNRVIFYQSKIGLNRLVNKLPICKPIIRPF